MDVTAKGYGTVSFAVHPSIVDSALAVMFPTDFAFTPDAIHFDHRGQAQALALESFMQTVLMDATDQYLALEARAGASGSKKLALGAEGMRGEPPFRDLPLAARLQRLREYGFTVEPLGQGRFRLVRTGSGFPDSFPPGNGSRSGSATQQRSAGEEMRVETIYDSKTGNMSQTKFYVGNDLVSENELTAGGAEAQTTVYSGSAGEGRRVVRFSTPLPTWK